MTTFTPERVADYFSHYMFHEYEGGAAHVQRVSTWIGLLALGIFKTKNAWHISHSRQLTFEADGRRFKVRYNHSIKPRGGVEIVEVQKLPGSPELRVVKTIASLAEAEAFYNNPSV